MSRLEKIRELYLGQPVREFLDNDGNAKEYAELVFSGAIFGPGQEVIDEELGILTADDLAEAIQGLVEREQSARAARVAALEEHRAGTQFQPLDESSPTVSVLDATNTTTDRFAPVINSSLIAMMFASGVW